MQGRYRDNGLTSIKTRLISVANKEGRDAKENLESKKDIGNHIPICLRYTLSDWERQINIFLSTKVCINIIFLKTQDNKLYNTPQMKIYCHKFNYGSLKLITN